MKLLGIYKDVLKEYEKEVIKGKGWTQQSFNYYGELNGRFWIGDNFHIFCVPKEKFPFDLSIFRDVSENFNSLILDRIKDGYCKAKEVYEVELENGKAKKFETYNAENEIEDVAYFNVKFFKHFENYEMEIKDYRSFGIVKEGGEVVGVILPVRAEG